MNVCEWCGCVLFAGIRHARCETAVAMAAPRERKPDGTFWLGADAEPGTETHRGYCPSSRDLSDLTTMEAAIYRQAYAEGHAAARQSVSAARGYQGSAMAPQPAQRPADADCGASLDYSPIHERGDR
jgi:hypothetical protein